LSEESEIEATQSSVTFNEELVKILKDNVAQKTELEYQLLNGEAQLASSRHDLLTQQNDLLTSKQQLNTLLGRDISIPFRVTPANANPSFSYDPDQAEEQALSQRPETREARLQVEAAETEVEIQKSGYQIGRAACRERD